MFKSKKNLLEMNRALELELERTKAELEAAKESNSKMQLDIDSLEEAREQLADEVHSLHEKEQETYATGWGHGSCFFDEILVDLLEKLMESNSNASGDVMGIIYNVLSKTFDKDGYTLYHCTKTDVCKLFPFEDNQGRFENMDGYDLFQWVINDRFGEITYSQIPNSSYECVDGIDLSSCKSEIDEYTKQCEKETVARIVGMLKGYLKDDPISNFEYAMGMW